MLISTDHNFLFVHVPKNTGSSIHHVLSPYCLQAQKKYPEKILTKLHLDFNWQHHHFRGHASLRDAEKNLPAELFVDLYKFAVVRNPWDSMVSHFHFAKQRKGHWWSKARANRMSFSDFLRFANSRRNRPACPYVQKPFLVLKNGEIGINRLLRFESLLEDWTGLMQELGLERELPTVNISKHMDYSEFYNDSDRQFVANHWREDIEAFDYAFI
jgi:hypothetical protein